MTNYEKYGFCPFSKQLTDKDCGTICFCDNCDTYFEGYDKGMYDLRDILAEEGFIYTKQDLDAVNEIIKGKKNNG